jgi:DNA primase
MTTTTDRPPLPSIWDDPSFDFRLELERREVWLPAWKKKLDIRCPLPEHEDRRASCSLGERDGVWLFYCHACNFGGDGVTLLAALDGMTAAEWLRIRASRAAPLPVPVPAAHQRQPEPAFRPLCTPEELAGYLDACHEGLLTGTDSAAVRRYARDRGLTGAEVRAWRIGFGISTKIPKLWCMRGRLVFPCPGGVEARAVDSAQPKYLSANLLTERKMPFALHEVRSERGPLVIVEGVFDALALHRAEVQAVALRGKRLAPEVAAHLRERGFTSGYISLDADAEGEAVLEVGRTLVRSGITPYWVQGPPGVKDWGDLLARPVEELLAAVSEGLVQA